MPGLDRTGPSGRGAMTGGGRGICNPNPTPASDYAGAGAVGAQNVRPYGAHPGFDARGRTRRGLAGAARGGRRRGHGRRR